MPGRPARARAISPPWLPSTSTRANGRLISSSRSNRARGGLAQQHVVRREIAGGAGTIAADGGAIENLRIPVIARHYGTADGAGRFD